MEDCNSQEQFYQSLIDFSVRLLHALSKENSEENLFFSPASLSVALAMCYAGAAGETADQMQKVLFSNLTDDKVLHDAYANFVTALNNKSDAYQLHTANCLYLQFGFDVLQQFMEIIQKKYQSDVKQVDFKSNAEGVRKEINEFVEKVTLEKIKDLILPRVLDSDTRLVLVNAIYFKGNWADQFQPSETIANHDFFVTPEKKLQVSMMVRSDSKKFLYFEDDHWQVLHMPYVMKEVEMIILLPKEKCGLAKLEKQLNGQSLFDLIQHHQQAILRVLKVPKFKLKQQFTLNEALKKLGCTQMFEDADFSNITHQSLNVSAVVHKAFVEVNEEGTEAAAATAVVMVGRSAVQKPKTVEFLADHPFLFVIWHKASKTPLFLGKLVSF